MDGGHAYREQRSAALPATVWTAGVSAGPSTILTDGCMDLIWDGMRILVAGPDRTVARHVMVAPAVLTAVRFDPGVAPSVLGVPAAEFVDRRVDLADVWSGPQLAPWLDALRRTDRPGRTLALLSAQRLQGGPPPWIGPVLRLLDGGAPVTVAAAAAGVTARQLGRWSQARFGYGPKTLQRILRMRRALSLLGGGTDLSAVAHREGYADYSHLFREFRALTGSPPASFVPPSLVSR